MQTKKEPKLYRYKDSILLLSFYGFGCMVIIFIIIPYGDYPKRHYIDRKSRKINVVNIFAKYYSFYI